ncbi:MAG TPA: DUF5687 family protein, partial [Pseudomonadales bacterium]|nr:DUF5687 family protein [Pseudomonadales bacterium]
RLLFFYFLIDLIVRFSFQPLPTLSIQPYLTLPIKKSTLIHYPIIKSLFSVFNLVAILLILPFFIKNICLTKSYPFSVIWLIIVLSLIVGNNFLNFSVKKYFSKQALISILFLLCVGLLIYLEIAKVISVSAYFSAAVLSSVRVPAYAIAPILFAVLTYYLAYSILKNNAYIEDAQKLANRGRDTFSFLQNYGEIGQLIGVELKMVLRNKRPRSLLYVSGIFLLYGVMFYEEKRLNNDLILSFCGLLLTSIFSVNYGQFLFSWESSFFDGIMANKITRFNYIKSKHLFFSIFCILNFIVALPFALISYKIAFINLAFLLYNIGISSVVMMFFSTFNTSYIDIGKSQFMNYQGTNATQFLIMIPILGVPMAIYWFHHVLGIISYFYYSIALLGLMGMACNTYLLELVQKSFMKRRYEMAVGFREK